MKIVLLTFDKIQDQKKKKKIIFSFFYAFIQNFFLCQDLDMMMCLHTWPDALTHSATVPAYL